MNLILKNIMKFKKNCFSLQVDRRQIDLELSRRQHAALV
jgi:hypothetical protein